MQKIEIYSGCKINLYLHIGKRLESGYHELESLFIPLDTPCDRLSISYKEIQHERLNVSENQVNGSLSINSDFADLDLKSNTLSKSFELYTKLRPLNYKINLYLEKKVPVGAGLGGGSANAAVFLNFLQSLKNPQGLPPLHDDALINIAKRVGSDVPFFLKPGVKKVSGIGDKLNACKNPFSGYYLVLVCPKEKISTAWAFNKLDQLRKSENLNIGKSLTRPRESGINMVSYGALLRNDFEKLVFKEFPNLVEVKDSLLKMGAEYALMSGTGSSIFGLFKEDKKAQVFIDQSKYTVYKLPM